MIELLQIAIELRNRSISDGYVKDMFLNETAHKLLRIAERANWTPCADGLPENVEGFQPFSRHECTIKFSDGALEVFTMQRSGAGAWFYETGRGIEYMDGNVVVAWRNVSEPYNPDHIIDANKKIEPIISDARIKQSDSTSKLDAAKAGMGGFIGT